MNLNPLSPFSGKPLKKIDAREGDAWCELLLTGRKMEQDNIGIWGSFTDDGLFWILEKHYTHDWAAAGPLMEREEMHKTDTTYPFGGTAFNSMLDEAQQIGELTPYRVCLWFIIAATHAKEQQDAVE